jgi:hypothetical protein
MYQQIVTLQDTDTLVLEWEEYWHDLTVKKDGKLLATLSDKATLSSGRQVILPDGKSILVVLTKNGLEVWYEGRELVSNLKTGKTDHYGIAFKAMVFVGAMNLLGGFIQLGGVLKTPFKLAACVGLLAIGAILVAIGTWWRYRGDKAPLWVGLILIVINLPLSIYLPNYLTAITSFYLLHNMYLGLQAQPYQPRHKKIIQENSPLDSDL